jgi:hypothetical protein
MWSAEEDRVVVTCSGYLGKKRTPFSAILLDPEVDDPEGMIAFRVTTTEDVKRRCETMTKAAAAEVAAYFVEHDRLPQGFHWTQDVTPFWLVTDIHP